MRVEDGRTVYRTTYEARVIKPCAGCQRYFITPMVDEVDYCNDCRPPIIEPTSNHDPVA